MISKLIFFICSLFGFCTAQISDDTIVQSPHYMERLESSGLQITESGQIVFYRPSNTMSGNYLSAQFAQNHHDWDAASSYLTKTLKYDANDSSLLNRAMVLSMGAGHPDRAIEYARQLDSLGIDDTGSLPVLFLAIDEMKSAKYSEALTRLGTVPPGSLANFIAPLLRAWAHAGLGELKTEELNSNTIHINHAFLIGEMLDNRQGFDELMALSLGASGLSVHDIERVADTLTLLDQHEDAAKLYEQALKNWPDNHDISKKLMAIQTGEKPMYFETVDTPQNGTAKALYDMAQLLSIEDATESSRVFVQLALYMNSDLDDAHLLAGYITAKNEQFDVAIKHYEAIPLDSKSYSDARRLMADLYEEQGQAEKAVEALEVLARNKKEVGALIQVGDIYRRVDDFKKAVDAYNRAEKALGGDITKEYWHLHYVRGIAYERDGQWNKAEADLLAALEYRPNHPLVLNYLGYAWADQGMNLEQSLEMVRKAVAGEPEDGYIIDSLGWVLYKMERFSEAVPHLEQAVELQPYDPIINDHLGDAYWQVGRHLEAQFQWERAKNYAEDQVLIETLTMKLDEGLSAAVLAKIDDQ